jgi:hypothetical protein
VRVVLVRVLLVPTLIVLSVFVLPLLVAAPAVMVLAVAALLVGARVRVLERPRRALHVRLLGVGMRRVRGQRPLQRARRAQRAPRLGQRPEPRRPGAFVPLAGDRDRLDPPRVTGDPREQLEIGGPSLA